MFKSGEYDRVFSNFVSLSLLQVANYVLPLVTIPYLIRVIGIDYFGLLSFTTAVIMYLYIVTEYGFNLTATKEVSLNRSDKSKLQEVYSSVICVKIILMLSCFLVLSAFVYAIPRLSSHWDIYFYTFGIVVGQVMFPNWFFQGMEKMGYVTAINVLSKSIFTVSVFVFVNERSDFYLVPILTSVGSIAAGIWSLAIIKKQFDIRFKLQAWQEIKLRFKEGWHVFISNIYTCTYTVSITFFLGIFTNDAAVGYYSVAEKIAKGVGLIFVPINDALFPHISKLVAGSPHRAIGLLNKLSFFSITVMSVISALMFYFADEIILLVTGDTNKTSVYVLQVLSLHPLVLTLSRIFAYNYLVNFGCQSVLSKIYLYTSLISLILIFTLIPAYYGIGAAAAIMLVEIFAMSYMYVEIRKNIFSKFA